MANSVNNNHLFKTYPLYMNPSNRLITIRFVDIARSIIHPEPCVGKIFVANTHPEKVAPPAPPAMPSNPLLIKYEKLKDHKDQIFEEIRQLKKNNSAVPDEMKQLEDELKKVTQEIRDLDPSLPLIDDSNYLTGDAIGRICRDFDEAIDTELECLEIDEEFDDLESNSSASNSGKTRLYFEEVKDSFRKKCKKLSLSHKNTVSGVQEIFQSLMGKIQNSVLLLPVIASTLDESEDIKEKKEKAFSSLLANKA